MKNLKVFVASIAIISSALAFSGCSLGGGGSGGDSKEVLKEAFANLYNVTSAGYSVTTTGDIDSAGDKVKVDMGFSGVFDIKNPKEPQFSMKAAGTGSLNGGAEQTVDSEIRLNKDNAYFIVSALSDFEGQIPAELVAPYLSKWWAMPIPAGSFDEMPATIGGDENLTPEEKQMKDLLKATVLFKDITLEGTEGNTSHYKAVLDKEAVKTLSVEGAKIQGQTLTEQELTDLDTSLQNINFSADIWVNNDIKTVTKLSGTLVATPTAQDSANITFSIALENVNGPVTIEVPADTSLFDPMVFLGAMMGGTGTEVPLEEVPAL